MPDWGSLLPHLAHGAVIEPRPGGTPVLVGEAGEREYVIPEHDLKNGGTPIDTRGIGSGGNSYHINLSGLITQPITEEEIVKLLKRAEAMNGAQYG
jgi:hypothetical protein